MTVYITLSKHQKKVEKMKIGWTSNNYLSIYYLFQYLHNSKLQYSYAQWMNYVIIWLTKVTGTTPFRRGCLTWVIFHFHYCRLLFSELRRSVEHLAGHPRCPSSVRSLVFKFTSFIANLAPAVTTVPPPQATSWTIVGSICFAMSPIPIARCS